MIHKKLIEVIKGHNLSGKFKKTYSVLKKIIIDIRITIKKTIPAPVGIFNLLLNSLSLLSNNLYVLDNF
jgi:hypothetical protein